MTADTDDHDATPCEGAAAADDSMARVHGAWRTWLSALASDSEAAMAAALAYESLPPEARDAWLDAHDRDACSRPSRPNERRSSRVTDAAPICLAT